MKELAGYVFGTASKMIDEASKAASGKDLNGVEKSINEITASAGAILQETRDNFIKEKYQNGREEQRSETVFWYESKWRFERGCQRIK